MSKFKMLRIKYIRENMLPDILSSQQVADYINVSIPTVNNYHKAYDIGDPKGLPNFRIGKLRHTRKTELLKWVKDRELESFQARQAKRKKHLKSIV